MQITAQMVSQLREQTGVGMMECKKALTEAEGDIDKARDILRSRGKAGAEKRAGRAAAEGVVAMAIVDGAAAIAELNCETDFVAKNEEFREFAQNLATIAATTKVSTNDELLDQALPSGQTARQRLDDILAKLRENIVFRRFVVFEPQTDSVIASYVHTVTNKIAVLVELKGDATSDAQKELARSIAMHVAAAKPEVLNREQLPAEAVAREREVLAELTRNEGKPEAAIAKIVEGRLGKYYERVCLVDQPYVKDTAKKIGDLVTEAGAELRRFTLYVVGQE